MKPNMPRLNVDPTLPEPETFELDDAIEVTVTVDGGALESRVEVTA